MLIRRPRSFSSDFPFNIFRVRHTSRISKRTHRREFWKITYIVSGKCQMLINGTLYPVAPGTLYLVHPEDETTYILKPGQSVTVYNVLFLPGMLDFGLREMNNDFSFFSIFAPHLNDTLRRQREQLYILDSNREIAAIFSHLEAEFKQARFNYQMVIKMELLKLLALIIRLGARKLKANRNAGIVAYIDTLIEENYGRELDYTALAREIGVTQSHLCRLYQRTRGRSIRQHLLTRRLQVAREKLLSEPTRTISEICFDCGFNDLSYFYRAFKKVTRFNPGDFREKFGLH